MPDQPHIIQKSTIDLQFNGRVDGFALQKEMDDWCRQELFPLLDEVFQPYAAGTEHIRIDLLEVRVDIDTNDQWKAKLTKDLARQLKEKMEVVHHTTGETGLSVKKEGQNFAELLVFYLEKGYLPWWSGVKTKAELLEQWRQWFQDDAAGMESIKEALQKEVVRLRVALHLPPGLFEAFAVKLNPSYKDLLPSIITNLEQITARFSMESRQKITVAFRVGLLQKINGEVSQIVQEVTKDLIEKVDALNGEAPLQLNAVIRKDDHQSQLQKVSGLSDHTLPVGEALFISNAGLVIIASFLPVLFDRLGILASGKMMQPSTAVCLLHFLLTGDEHPAEWELVLPKILCGIDIDEVVDTNVLLTEAQRSEADNLLLAVVEHWSVLKNTSIEGLREAFLQREGKLSFQNDAWLLQVEQKPFDMLLQHIPWNISFLKLSWMKHPLKTEWA